jgi:hypothetical protein
MVFVAGNYPSKWEGIFSKEIQTSWSVGKNQVNAEANMPKTQRSMA